MEEQGTQGLTADQGNMESNQNGNLINSLDDSIGLSKNNKLRNSEVQELTLS